MNIIKLPTVYDTALENIPNIFKISTLIYLIDQNKLSYWDAENNILKDVAGSSKQSSLQAGKNINISSNSIKLIDNIIINNLSAGNLFTTVNLSFINTEYLPLISINGGGLVHGDVLLLKEDGLYDYCKLTLSSNTLTKYSASFFSNNKSLSLIEANNESRGIYFNGNRYIGCILIGDFYKTSSGLSQEISGSTKIITRG